MKGTMICTACWGGDEHKPDCPRFVKTSPHPDTARADAAERMLAGVMAKVNTFSPSQNPAACLLRDVPGLRQWHVETGVRLEKIAQLTADLARLDAERERVARELAAIANTENAQR